MEPSKVYFCDLHTHMGDGLPNKLKRLIKAAGIGQIQPGRAPAVPSQWQFDAMQGQ